MSPYAAWSRREFQAAEPSADFDEVEAADDVLLEPLDPLDRLDSLEELDEDPLDDSLEDPPEDPLDDSLEDPLDDPDGAGTEAEELLRESVR